MAAQAARIALFDLGNVIVRWDPANLYTRVFPTQAEAERFLADIDWPAWHLRHDAGELFADTSAELIGRFPHYRAQIEAWFGRWSEMFDGYVPGIVEILHDLNAAGVPLFALTNLSAEIADETFALFPETARFQDIVVSGALRLVKPDPAIYAAALERIGAPAEDVFFTDDSAANIAAARALGFKAHLFEGAAGLRIALRAHGLLR